MEDFQIVELYWLRSEEAITQTQGKYGRMLSHISYSLLGSREDSEECVNDTYLAAWNSMPDERPFCLGAFLSKIVRRISISRYRAAHREKRGGAGAILQELSDCMPSDYSVTDDAENSRLSDLLNRFLYSLDEEKRYIFIRRYYYSDPIAEIAEKTGAGEGKVKTMLFRLRNQLKSLLEREGLL